MILDLDRFRLVNEALGHQSGDALLRAVAERLQGVMGEEWARSGGDEFVLLMPRVRSGEEAGTLARRILDVLAALSKGTDLSLGCYCEDEAHCHRSQLRALLLERGAKVE